MSIIIKSYKLEIVAQTHATYCGPHVCVHLVHGILFPQQTPSLGNHLQLVKVYSQFTRARSELTVTLAIMGLSRNGSRIQSMCSALLFQHCLQLCSLTVHPQQTARVQKQNFPAFPVTRIRLHAL